MSTRKTLFYLVLVLFILLMIGGAIAGAVKPKPKAGTPTSGPVTSTTVFVPPIVTDASTTQRDVTVPTPAPTPERPAPTTLAAPPDTQSIPQTMIGWWNDTGETDVNQLSSDLTAVSDAATSTDVPGMIAACATLDEDAVIAMRHPSIGVARADVLWQDALQSFASAGDDCQKGGTNMDPDVLQRAIGEVTQGGQDLTDLSNLVVNGG